MTCASSSRVISSPTIALSKFRSRPTPRPRTRLKVRSHFSSPSPLLATPVPTRTKQRDGRTSGYSSVRTSRYVTSRRHQTRRTRARRRTRAWARRRAAESRNPGDEHCGCHDRRSRPVILVTTTSSPVDEEVAEMEPLRPAAKRYLVTIVLAALATALVALNHVSALKSERIVLAVALAVAAMLAQLFPLHIAAKTKLYLDTAVLVAAVVLFEPGVALLLMGAGTALAHVARREPWDQTLFNTAQVVLLAAAGSALLTAAGWRDDQSTLDRPH